MAFDLIKGTIDSKDWSLGAECLPRVVTGEERWTPAQAKTLLATVNSEIETNGRLVLKRSLEKSLPVQDQNSFRSFFKAWRFFRDGLGAGPQPTSQLSTDLNRWRSENAAWTRRLSTPGKSLVKGDGPSDNWGVPGSRTAPPHIPKTLLAGLGLTLVTGVVSFIAGRASCGH